MRSIASAVTLKAAWAAGAPLLVIAALAWPRGTGTEPPPSRAIERAQAVVVDTAPVKQAALELAAQARASAAPRQPAAAPGATASDADADAARIRALGTLTERIYAARDVRRKEGKTGAELRKPFTLDELGGAQLTKDLSLANDARLLVLRTGTVLGPSGGALPAGLAFEADAKALASVASTSDITAVRYCPYGEVICLVDLTRTGGAPAAGTAAALDAAPEAAAPAALDTGKLEAALAALAATARVTPDASGAPSGVSSSAALVPFGVAWGLGVVVAIALLFWAAAGANAIAQRLVGVVARLQQAASGRAPDAAPASTLRELAMLHDAATAAARGLSDHEVRAGLEERRRLRADEIARAITHAASARDLSARIHVEDVDDAALLALVEASNRLLESLDHTVLRWQSHASATGSRADNARDLESRADALKPLPPLLSDTAQRLLRLAHVEGAPQRLNEELRALGEALGQRAKTAQALMDALLLDLATERPQARHDDALSLLKNELKAFKTSETAPERVAALKDLPPAEIGERVAVDRA